MKKYHITPYNLKLIIYILLSYSITWGILFPLSLYYSDLDIISRELWHSLGPFGPAIAGMISLYIYNKKSALKLLSNRLNKYSGRNLLLIAFSPIIILAFALLIEILSGISDIAIILLDNNITDSLSFLIFLLPSISYGFFEEIGWRGFLLPHFQTCFNALKSTSFLTFIWWFWHFPMFFYRYDIGFAIFFMLPLLLTGSILFTYLFNESNGSLLMVIIFHICYDLVTSHQISITATIIVSAFIIFLDIRIIKLNGVETFSTQPKVIISIQ